MKKNLVIALALVFVMAIASTAFAAANPFMDVPAKHWAYAAVTQLAKAGIVDGMSNGKFEGDKTMTRYEMAQIVAKAMANSAKADAANKAMIDKLSVEFASELNNLGVRVANLEKNASTIKFSGQVRELFENEKLQSATSPTYSRIKSRIRLFMAAPIDGNWTFKGRLAQEKIVGNNDGNNFSPDQMYLTGKVGEVGVTLGRQPLLIGVNTLFAMGTSTSWDGVRFSLGSDAVKVDFGALKRTDINYTFVDANYKVSDTFRLNAMYLKDKALAGKAAQYCTTTAGFEYKGLENMSVVGEFGKNNIGTNPKAWVTLFKYKAAKGSEVGSFDLFAGYTKSELGFDPVGYSGSDYVASVNDFKGYNGGFDYTVFKNGVLTANYFSGKKDSDNSSKKYFTTYLMYNF